MDESLQRVVVSFIIARSNSRKNESMGKTKMNAMDTYTYNVL